MKRLTGALLLLSLLVYPFRALCEETMQEMIAQVIASLETDALRQAGTGVTEWIGSDLPALIGDLAAGRKTISPQGIWESMKGQAAAMLLSFGQTALIIALPALVCAVIAPMSEALAPGKAFHMARVACFLLLLLPLTALTLDQAAAVKTVVEDMSGRMQALFPVLLTLLSAVGGSAASAFLQPALLSASAMMTQVVTQITLRLCICAAVVTAVNHLSGRACLGRLCALFKRLAAWSMGICSTAYIGVMTIQGVGTAVSDGISLRMAKYAVNHMVPVVGGMFSDTLDMLVGCSLLVKNAMGAVALLILLAVIFMPLLRLGAVQLIIRLCAAVLEPVAQPEIIACMDDFAGILSLLFTTLLCVGAMFFLLVAQLLLLGNLTVMMR